MLPVARGLPGAVVLVSRGLTRRAISLLFMKIPLKLIGVNRLI